MILNRYHFNIFFLSSLVLGLLSGCNGENSFSDIQSSTRKENSSSISDLTPTIKDSETEPNDIVLSGIGDPTANADIENVTTDSDLGDRDPQDTEHEITSSTFIVEEQALCFGNKGAGKKILFLSWFDSIKTKMVEQIANKTGIEFTFRSKLYVENLENHAKEALDIQNGEYDAIWIISNGSAMSPNLLNAVVQKNESGEMGVMLHAEAGLLVKASNDFFQTFQWDLQFEGNHPGLGYLVRDGYGFIKNQQGLIFNHPINSGVYQRVAEGISIAFLTGTFKDQLQPVLQNTGGGLLSAAYQKTILATGKERRVFMHGGFTTLNLLEDAGSVKKPETYSWDSPARPATPQFYMNAACWSAGIH